MILDMLDLTPTQSQLKRCSGYCNIFNPKRPSLHYRLRMFRPDEHEIAWQVGVWYFPSVRVSREGSKRGFQEIAWQVGV